MRYELLGSNFDLTWADTGWTQIATGQTGLSTARRAANTVTFANTQSFKHYKLMLVDLRNAATAFGMQVAQQRHGITFGRLRRSLGSFDRTPDHFGLRNIP
jgi:hypothetical protein